MNRKPVRVGALDYAEFPYIIQVEYIIEGKVYKKRKWISAGAPVPKVGSTVKVMYNSERPTKIKLL